MSDVTGSGIERAVQCPASSALNQARSTGEAAIKGVENHDGIEGDLAAGTSSKHKVVREALADAVDVRVEVAYALDVEAETVRFLGSRLGRKYGPLKDSEIALTLDLVTKTTEGDGVWWVWDWKSRKRVTPAARNWQLKAGAVAVMKHMHVSSVRVGIGYLDNDEADTHAFDAFDIPVFFADMRSMLTRINTARSLVKLGQIPEVHSGSWCDYCPALAYCPAHTRLALNMLGELEDIKGKVAFMTPEQVSKAWDIKKRLESMLETVDESLRLRISQSVIPRPNGKRLALVDCKRTGFDASAAKKRLTELGEDLSRFNRTTEYTQVKEVNAKE